MDRCLRQLLRSKLVGDRLFGKCLKSDVARGNVFPAIRKNVVNFYYGGGSLFRFDESGTFRTHIKYASIVKSDKNVKYVSQEDLGSDNIVLAKDFVEHYADIKENCKRYGGKEARGVAGMFGKYSCAKAKSEFESKVILLDIEVGFSSEDVEHDTDRIDMLALNTESKTLRFYEAKHFTNQELVARETPPVVEQIQRYERQLELEKKREHILDVYREYVEIIKAVFAPLPKLCVPEHVDEQVGLYVFGFDDAQRQVRLPNIAQKLREQGIRLYAKGKPESVDMDNMWKETQ